MLWWEIVLIVAGIIAVFAFILCLLYYVALPRIVINKMRNAPNPDGEMTYPENYGELQEKITADKDLTYPSKYPSNQYNLYYPKEHTDSVPLIVWVHGGGFIGGSKDGGDNVMVALSSAGYAVASIDYAVAPEHKYPTAVRQVAEFAEHLSELKKQYPFLDTDKIIFGGDSAGAQIAAQYVATQTNGKLADEMKIKLSLSNKIKAALLVCGPFCFSSIRDFAAAANKKLKLLVNMWGRIYYGKLRWYHSKAEKQTNVIAQVTEHFPPVFLTDGNKGSFEAQNRKLGDKLKTLGVPVEELYFDASLGDIPHEYLFHLDQETSQTCMNQIIAFLQKTVL